MKVDNQFGGVFAKDRLRIDVIKPNNFYIINLDDFNSPTNGTHWTAFYYYNKRIEYFDSYGLKPPQIIAQNFSYVYNSSQLQSYESKACGYYCLYFIFYRYNGLSYYKILKYVSLVDCEYNQKVSEKFFNSYNYKYNG